MKREELMKQLLEQVTQMRKAQRSFFRTKEREHLEDAKRLEKKVDEIIKNIEMHDDAQQLDMF